MIDGISSSASGSLHPRTNFDNPLTEDQKTKLEEILANYDSENLSENDTIAIMDEIKSAGIAPGKELKETMEAAGFDIKPPNGERRAERSEGDRPEFIRDFIAKSESGEVTEEDVDTFLQTLRSNGQDTVGFFVDEAK